MTKSELLTQAIANMSDEQKSEIFPEYRTSFLMRYKHLRVA